MVDLGEQLRTRAELLIPAGVDIDPTAYEIAEVALNDIEKAFGENSDDPREHHNARHGLDHIGHGLKFINLIEQYIPEEYQGEIRELAIVDGAVHDRYQHLKKLGVNEIFSTAYGMNLIDVYGSQTLNSDRFKTRSAGGVLATTAFVKSDGSIVQPKLLEGEPDPHKLFMGVSDVYAPIAMGGIEEMLRASRNLTLEQYKNPTPIQGYNFVVGEIAFLRKGLNPHRIKKIIAHFFPDSADEIYAIFHDLFNQNIVDASEFAQAVDRRTDKAEEIGEALLEGEFEVIEGLVKEA